MVKIYEQRDKNCFNTEYLDALLMSQNIDMKINLLFAEYRGGVDMMAQIFVRAPGRISMEIMQSSILRKDLAHFEKHSRLKFAVYRRVLKVELNLFSSFLCRSMSCLIFVVGEVLLGVGQLDEEKEEKGEKEEKARMRLLLILLISVVNTFLPDKVDTLLPTWQKIS